MPFFLRSGVSTRTIALIALASLAGIACVGARGVDPNDPNQPAGLTCRNAGDELRLRPNAPRYGWAFPIISRCPNGANQLAAAWSPPSSDPVQVASLTASSISLADRRVLLAALTAFQDTAQSPAIRWRALEVVVAQHTPARRLLASAASDSSASTLGIPAHQDQIAGEHPPTDEDRRHVLEVLRHVASSDPDSTLRRVANATARELEGYRAR